MLNNEAINEIRRRRTFAIISHPDAGKTTLTEKLLLYGGAIHLAGSIKARKAKMHATSDWMEIEKERGISVTSSVLQFEYKGLAINLLDTPGHKDFSEDTYRTLMAVDSAVMLIDHAKGVEPQTRKLFEVCRMRGIPIITFINKLDRYGRDPFELMDEVEDLLKIKCVPMNWPVGRGYSNFKGVYVRKSRKVILFQDTKHGQEEGNYAEYAVDDPELRNVVTEEDFNQLRDDLEILDHVIQPFELADFQEERITPVYFGSAMNNFGVQPFLDEFINIAPLPRGRKTKTGFIEPEDERFSGFAFKIQANLDPKHRDRIVFVRICSGVFESGMKGKLARTDKEIRLANPQQFMAQERSNIQKAYAGDIIGLYDSGQFHIGDTIYSADRIEFEAIPHFSPENFVYLKLADPMKRKQMQTGLQHLAEEGSVQVYYKQDYHDVVPILGAVGWLQFEVFQYRLENEYNAKVTLEPLDFKIARWLRGEAVAIEKFIAENKLRCVKDSRGETVALFESQWKYDYIAGQNQGVEFWSYTM